MAGHILLDFLRSEYRRELAEFGRDEDFRAGRDAALPTPAAKAGDHVETRLRPERGIAPVKGNGTAAAKTPERVTVPAKPLEKVDTRRTAEIVLEQVRLVARERADELTLDTPITEIGLDSLERMEILSALQDRFGNRFPEEILIELETCNHVIDAVITYLGTEPRPVRHPLHDRGLGRVPPGSAPPFCAGIPSGPQNPAAIPVAL